MEKLTNKEVQDVRALYNKVNESVENGAKYGKDLKLAISKAIDKLNSMFPQDSIEATCKEYLKHNTDWVLYMM